MEAIVENTTWGRSDVAASFPSSLHIHTLHCLSSSDIAFNGVLMYINSGS